MRSRSGATLATAAVCLVAAGFVAGNNVDLFSYEYKDEDISSGGTIYAQENWGFVTCDDLETCSGYPEKFLEAIQLSNVDIAGPSNCRWCKEGEPETCGLHRQSPIDLKRDRGLLGSPTEHDCPDWHFMRYEDGTCPWESYVDNFRIERHALEVHVPTKPDGQIDCFNASANFSAFPRIDYSKGFPDWWWYDHTSITVPSSHSQEGKQYDAEVILAHFYEIEHPKNQLGYVSIFLDAYPDTDPWPYLDKLICQWRKVEEEARSACGLDPAPPYGRCSLFRDQEPSKEWLQDAGTLSRDPTASPTGWPTGSPAPVGSPPPSTSMSPTAEWYAASGGLGSNSPSIARSPVEAPSESPTSGSSSKPAPESPTSVPTSKPSPESPTSVPSSKPATESPIIVPTSEPSPASDLTRVTNGWGHFVDILRPIPTTNTSVEPNGTAPSESPERGEPSSAPVTAGNASSVSNATAGNFSCDAYSVSYARMCNSSSPCCETQRSDTDFCWDLYENVFPDELIYAACEFCCESGPKEIGPPALSRVDLPKTIQCSSVENPFRVCSSCCEDPRSTSGYCSDIYAQYGEDIEQICYYCCSEPKTVGSGARYLRTRPGAEMEAAASDTSSSAQFGKDVHGHPLPPGAKATMVNNKRFVLSEDDFRESVESDEEYFDRVYTDFKHREMQDAGVHELDYEDVRYWPYEWLVKVETEYYFRYEGTMIVPPCWEVVHWRTMKDPIRVHQRQIDELNRLLAWRIDPSPSCKRETAGRVSDDGNRVMLNRDIQYIHLQHRLVFCECKDWPSKFPNDKEWCTNWRTDSAETRFYKTPYSFDSHNEW